MNKLIFIYLLSLIILNTKCTKSCDQLTPPNSGPEMAETPTGDRRRLTGDPCTHEELVKPNGYNCVPDGNKCVLKSLCELEKDTTKCETHKELTDQKCVKDDTQCKLVSASTDSSNILNIFKITFILLFIFTIL